MILITRQCITLLYTSIIRTDAKTIGKQNNNLFQQVNTIYNN